VCFFFSFSLAQKYCDEVANPMEMIMFRKISGKTRRALNERSDDLDDIAELFQGDVRKLSSVFIMDIE